MYKNNNEYYEYLRVLAREKRKLHNVDTSNFGLREARKIYKAEGIKIDYWPLPSKIKALYMCADNYFSVAIQKSLPDEPKLFALLHELKHHYVDQKIIEAGIISCGDYNRNKPIEIGAEIFAAEFIYPMQEFIEDVSSLGITNWTAEDIVRLKRNCKAKVSYQYLLKRLTRAGMVTKNQFKGVKFRKLEDQIYGVPFYRRKRKSNK